MGKRREEKVSTEKKVSQEKSGVQVSRGSVLAVYVGVIAVLIAVFGASGSIADFQALLHRNATKGRVKHLSEHVNFDLFGLFNEQSQVVVESVDATIEQIEVDTLNKNTETDSSIEQSESDALSDEIERDTSIEKTEDDTSIEQTEDDTSSDQIETYTSTEQIEAEISVENTESDTLTEQIQTCIACTQTESSNSTEQTEVKAVETLEEKKEQKTVPVTLPQQVNKKATAQFYNFDFNRTVNVFWIDSEGIEKLACILNPTSNCFVRTWKGHVFVTRFEDDSSHRDTFRVPTTSWTVHSHFGVPEIESKEDYKQKNQKTWINVWPRALPNLPLWYPSAIGEIAHIQSKFAQMKKISKEAPLSVENSVVQESSISFAIKTLQVRPKLFQIENFLSEDESDYIIALGKSQNLKRSTIVSESTDARVNKDRTSSNTNIHCFKDPIMKNISQRVFDVLRIPTDHEVTKFMPELMQLVHYKEGEQYRYHYDFFDPLDGTKNRMKSALQKGANRFVTFFIYLNDVEEGGNTVFPLAGGRRMSRDPCKTDFSVKPKKGAAIWWYSLTEEGNLDHDSLHGGCPVEKGEKWAVNYWIWDPYMPSHLTEKQFGYL